MAINWYPGHMAKTRRLMVADMSQVDLVCEILDARIPLSSRNPDLVRIAAGKRRMIALNRADQADPAVTDRWAGWFRRQGAAVIVTDSQKGGFLDAFTAAAREQCADLLARNAAKGVAGKRVRIMIFGVPNVGKSSFINRLLGKKSAVAEDRPGVTRQKQWYALPGGFDFMDTPGMLWPKIDDDAVG
jgi:ribosome biogenesis GTPase A